MASCNYVSFFVISLHKPKIKAYEEVFYYCLFINY